MPENAVLRGFIAVAAAAVVAGLAWRAGALRRSGAIAATGVGASVLGFGGLGAAAVLVLFFVTSSGLSALPDGRDRANRDARQVLANGSVAAVAAVFHGAHPFAPIAFLGALATATADTWATELGVRLGANPRSILSFRPVPPGTSGAVSVPGTLAGAAGALAVAGVGDWLVATPAGGAFAAVAAAGLIGALVDSVLGAGLQAVYRCPACGAAPEVARHAGCPTRAARVSGVPGLDNDGVNLLATAAGAAAAVLLQGLLPPVP